MHTLSRGTDLTLLSKKSIPTLADYGILATDFSRLPAAELRTKHNHGSPVPPDDLQARIGSSSRRPLLPAAFSFGYPAPGLRVDRHRAHRAGLSAVTPVADKAVLQYARPKHGNAERSFRL